MASYLLWKSGLAGDGGQRGLGVARLMEQAAKEKLDTPGKDHLAQTVAKGFGIDYQALLNRRMFQIMSPEEVSKISRNGIDFELHAPAPDACGSGTIPQRNTRQYAQHRRIHRTPSQAFLLSSGVTSPAVSSLASGNWGSKRCDMRSRACL